MKDIDNEKFEGIKKPAVQARSSLQMNTNIFGNSYTVLHRQGYVTDC